MNEPAPCGVLKNSVYRLLKKISEARRAKDRSFGFAQDGLGGSVHSQYVGARRLNATKRMSLLQQPASAGHDAMLWRRLFPVIFLFTMVDGFISNWLYPARLPLLYRDFLIIGVYGLFISQEPAGQWVSQLRERAGPGAWFLAMSFMVVGLLEVFNPLSPDLLVGLLGLKVLFLYWPLAILAYAYVDSLERARGLAKAIVFFSVPISLFGLYQFRQGPEFLVSTFGPGFERATVMAWIEGIGPDDSFLRIIGTFPSSGQFGSFIQINAMLCFGLLFSTK